MLRCSSAGRALGAAAGAGDDSGGRGAPGSGRVGSTAGAGGSGDRSDRRRHRWRLVDAADQLAEGVLHRLHRALLCRLAVADQGEQRVRRLGRVEVKHQAVLVSGHRQQRELLRRHRLLQVDHQAHHTRLVLVDIDALELSPALRELVGKVRADDPFIAGVRVGRTSRVWCAW